jgi:arylsulfatase A
MTKTIASILTLAAAAALAAAPRSSAQTPAPRPPNIVFILADDLGSGEIGSYGQTKIRTPRLDRMAAEGMRFTRFYSGSPVCAPSRATFLTGKHTGHSYVRDNKELGGFLDEEERGQLPLPSSEPTVAEWLKTRGYATALVGKWGLGGPGSIGLPTKHGFDLFFGYLDQKQAHNFYPTHLWKNDERFPLANAYFSPHQKLDGAPSDAAAYAKYRGTDYAIDFMTREAVSFVRANAARPFFLYFAPTLPHLALQAPEAAVRAYDGAFPETPYLGDKQYLPNRTPRATYAAMISYLDAQVGQVLDALKAAGVDDNTLVIFTSDNGATFDTGGAPTAFFNSHGGLRGAKTDVYEGGIRVPFLARWPGKVRAGVTSDHIGANWDMWATFAEIAGGSPPAGADGVSIAATLLGRGKQAEHEALYWEFHAKGSSQAVRMGRWKGVRTKVKGNPGAPIELYDLDTDPAEAKDVAAAHPDIVRRIERVMQSRTPSPIEGWNFQN